MGSGRWQSYHHLCTSQVERKGTSSCVVKISAEQVADRESFRSLHSRGGTVKDHTLHGAIYSPARAAYLNLLSPSCAIASFPATAEQCFSTKVYIQTCIAMPSQITMEPVMSSLISSLSKQT